MFGLAWSEILIIGVVALVVVGPKDLPRAMRTAARWMRAGQKLAREFQGHVDDLVREAELEELREKIQKAASEPLSTHVAAALDPGGVMAEALNPPEGLIVPPTLTTASEVETPAAPAEPAVAALPAAEHPVEHAAAVEPPLPVGVGTSHDR